MRGKALLCALALLCCPLLGAEALRVSVGPIDSVESFESKIRPELLACMQRAMGPLPGKEKRCDLDVQVTEETDCGDYIRRFISYQSEPGSRVPAYLLIPKRVLEKGRKCPGVLCLHQTHPEGQKVVVGLGNSPNDEYGIELVRRGYVCIRASLSAPGKLFSGLEGSRLSKRDDESDLG